MKIRQFFTHVLTLCLFNLANSGASHAAFDYSTFEPKLKYAQSEIRAERYDMAISTLQELAASAKGNRDAVRVNFLLALAFKSKGDFRQAQVYISQPLVMAPNDASVNFLAAEIYDGLGQSTVAQGFYAKSGRSRSPVSGIARDRLSSSYFGKVIDLGCWQKDRMPLQIYIDDGRGVAGYEPRLRQEVVNALLSWQRASNNELSFELLPRSTYEGRDASRDYSAKSRSAGRDIHIHWRPLIVLPGKEPLGLTQPKVEPIAGLDALVCVDVYIATNETSDGKTYTSQHAVHYVGEDKVHEHELHHVILHEIGHALGLGHSTQRADIMSPVVFGGLSTDTVANDEITSGDATHMVNLLQRVWIKHLPADQDFARKRQIAQSSSVRFNTEQVDVSKPIDNGHHVNQLALFNNEGIRALNNRNYSTAISKFLAALKISANDTTAKEQLALAFAQYAQQLDGVACVSSFRRSLFLSSDNGDAREGLRKALLAAGLPAATAEDRRALAEKALANNNNLEAYVEYKEAQRLSADTADGDKADSLYAKSLNELMSYSP
ncbi:MAG TPA: matrixin family metalloprotease [Candidatus Obscuribacterales bacterium]